MLGNIHNKYHLHEVIRNQQKRLAEEVDKLEISEKADINALLEGLKSKFTIEPIVLKEPQASEPTETTREMRSGFGETYKQKVFKINVTIPFDGDQQLFFCSPRTTEVVYLDESVTINSKSISATITLDDLDAKKYQSQVTKLIEDLQRNIPTVNSEIAPWNNDLERKIQNMLQERKGVVAKKHTFMEEIGLKIEPKSSEYLIPPPIAKKIIPTPVTETTKGVKAESIPVLQQQVYDDIKEVLYNVGKAIERKPSIYKDKHEEDLRDVFLLFLESRYEATSGLGEAFNRNGDTDILLKYAPDGSNIFVAECKIWKGQKQFLDAIDQLFGYLTHRDSKTALIYFVKQKEFTAILGTIKREVVKHPNFKRFVQDTYDSSIQYEFSLPDDSRKIIQVEVMLFHYPAIN